MGDILDGVGDKVDENRVWRQSRQDKNEYMRKVYSRRDGTVGEMCRTHAFKGYIHESDASILGTSTKVL